MLRPSNAGANSAADQIPVAEAALQQIPREHIETITCCCAQTAQAPATRCWTGRTREHPLHGRPGSARDVREQILQIADSDWIAAVEQDGDSGPTAKSPSSAAWTSPPGQGVAGDRSP